MVIGITNKSLHITEFTVRKPGKEKQKIVEWRETLASQSIPLFTPFPECTQRSRYIHCMSCVTDSLDVARIGSFVVIHSDDEV